MITKFFNRAFLAILFVSSFTFNSFAQNCGKKTYCDKDFYEDFDFTRQSNFALLAPGDTVRLDIAVYNNQEYRIMLGNDPILGDIQFKVIKQDKKYKKVIKEINTIEGESQYKMDEYGNYVLDDYGDFVMETSEPIIDTVWNSESYIEETVLFDNLENDSGLPYWDSTFDKPQGLVVEVLVPEGDETIEGCVHLLIGRRPPRKKGFSRNQFGK